jgi:hypothetical protein
LFPTSSPFLNGLVGFIAVPLAMFVVLFAVSVWRRRQSIGRTIRNIVLVEAVYLGGAVILSRLGVPGIEAVLLGLILSLLVVIRLPARRRYIPASERRRAIARHELKTGRKFDHLRQEIDHEVPFARGGGHSADNLQVMDRKANRGKGAKSPWWDVLGRH